MNLPWQVIAVLAGLVWLRFFWLLAQILFERTERRTYNQPAK